MMKEDRPISFQGLPIKYDIGTILQESDTKTILLIVDYEYEFTDVVYAYRCKVLDSGSRNAVIYNKDVVFETPLGVLDDETTFKECQDPILKVLYGKQG
jgi:hypothetical protein